jgi:hypothetical protein
MFFLRLTRPHRVSAVLQKGVLLILLLICTTAGGASAAVLPSTPMNTQASGTALVFYAQQSVSDDLWPLLFQILRADLAAGMGKLPNGVDLDREPTILRGSDDLRGVSFSSVVSVKLLGRCDRLPQVDGSPSDGPLGWVVRVSGKIQPFVYIDCARLSRELRPVSASLSKAEREHVMAQAISRVLIHEWSHIAGQSPAHSRRGLTQAYLSPSDLIGAPKDTHLSASRR